MQKLEERVGPEGRKIFERFLEQVRRLQEKQRLAIMGEEAEEAEVIKDEADAESGPMQLCPQLGQERTPTSVAKVSLMTRSCNQWPHVRPPQYVSLRGCEP